MERRVLLAISLSFLVLFAYQSFFPPAELVPPSATPGAPAQTSPAVPAAATTGEVTAAPAAAAPAAVQADGEEREFVIETGSVRAVFTNRGARLKHWELKRYRREDGAPVDLVPADTGGQPLPFSLQFDAAADTAAINNALFVAENNAPAVIDATTSPAALTFVFESADGLAVRKRFTLQPSGFEVSFLAEVTRGGAALNPGSSGARVSARRSPAAPAPAGFSLATTSTRRPASSTWTARSSASLAPRRRPPASSRARSAMPA